MLKRAITKRIDAITLIPDEYQKEIVPCPKSVKIELTAKCNYNCSFCATGARLRAKKDMDFDFYKRIVKEMRRDGVEELGVFYLGESFLCSWLPEAIRYAKEECGYPYVFLTTNGSLATPEAVKACMAAGLDSLKFSFNYSDDEQFEAVARVKRSNFCDMMQNIMSAWQVREEGGYQCGLYASSIMYSGDQQQRMEGLVAQILPYVDEHYWLPLYGQAGLIEKDGRTFTAGNQGRIGALRKPLPCWSMFTEGHITWDGTLAACCFDHDGRFNMGDLKESAFMEAWNSEKFQALRKANLNKNVKGTACEKCMAFNE